MMTLSDYYWWHRRLLVELRRLETLSEPMPGYNHRGLAGNVNDSATDTLRYLEQLCELRLVEPCEPLWDAPAEFRWYRLTDQGRQLIGA